MTQTDTPPAAAPQVLKPPVLVLGAGSDIARALAHLYAAEGHPLQLAARDPARLERDRDDYRLRHGVSVSLHAYDALAPGAAGRLFDALPELPGVVVCAVGLMPEQAAAQADPELAARVVASNFTGPALALQEAAARMAASGRGGVVIGISSVAGDRGRAKNGWYGAAKAGFTAFLSALRQAHARTGVHVMTVRPGFVATRMTEGMDLPAPLTDSAEGLARAIKAAAARRANGFVPWKWRLVMGVIANLPEAVFKRTRF